MPYPGSDDNEELYSVPQYHGVSFKPAEITAHRKELELKDLLSGRPDRQTVIDRNDLIDLLIALHKSQSLEEFLERI